MNWIELQIRSTGVMRLLATTFMKQLLIAIALICTCHAQLELKWEYRPSPESILGPNPTPANTYFDLNIDRYLTSPSGYILLSVSGRWSANPQLSRVAVLLNPDGEVDWMSGNVASQFPEYSSPIIIPIHVGPESAVACVTSPYSTTGGKLLSYHKRSIPQQNVIVGPNEVFVPETIANAGANPSPQSGFNGTTFYTLVQDPALHPSIRVAFRKYALAVASPAEVVVPNESGVQDKNLVLRWQTIQGARYQVQESTDLNDWSDVGLPMDGTGANQTWSQAISQPAKFFRVIQR